MRVCVCVCSCARACVHACVRACVCVCKLMYNYIYNYLVVQFRDFFFGLCEGQYTISLYSIAFISADIFRFDNTYSWMTNKKVYYELELMEVSKDPMFKERKPTVAVAGAVEEVTHL